MDLGLTGKVALVTGSSRGIGRGVALTLAEEGCDVMLTGRDEAALAEVTGLIEKHGRRAKSTTLDLRKDGAAAALIEAVKSNFGRLDILVNNAGTTKRGDFLALTDDDWAEGYALKFFAHVRLSRAAWPLLSAVARLDCHHRRHQRPYSDCGFHHRIVGQRRLRRIRQGAWPIAARPTMSRSTRFIQVTSKPSAFGAASRPTWSAPARPKPKCGSGTAPTSM